MPSQPAFKKTVLCALIGSMAGVCTLGARAESDVLDFDQMPPGHAAPSPAPNVIISIDNSGGMNGTLSGSNATKMNELKDVLSSVFKDGALLPDGKIRLAWQAMQESTSGDGTGTLTNDPSALNRMKVLDAQHRQHFLNFVNSLQAIGPDTASHRMLRQAHNYMANTTGGIYSPWAGHPGVTAQPWLECRRSYHVFITGGNWNKVNDADKGANSDGTDWTLPDGKKYAPGTADARIFADTRENTLSDWALKSWATDLQPGIDNKIVPGQDYLSAPDVEIIKPAENNKTSSASIKKYWNPKYDPATWQHLATYPIGYGTGAQARMNSIYSGLGGSPSQTAPVGWDGVYPYLLFGSAVWPDVLLATPSEVLADRSIDLWHAAINGRGRFYEVATAADLKKALQDFFQHIMAATMPAGAGGIGASGSSSVYDDVGIFTTGYDPAKAWSGYVYADTYGANGSLIANKSWGAGTGTEAPGNHITTADKLDALGDIHGRLILTTRDGDAKPENNQIGVLFKWAADASYLSTAQKALLSPNVTAPASGSQDSQENIIDFLRGDRSKEGGTADKPYRVRQSRQGDIVNSGVWYVGAPTGNDSQSGYKEFRQQASSRDPMIYVGGNDGMLHGFLSENGTEKIAYVPKGLMDKLKDLSSPAYSHRYYVDNTPFSGDAYAQGWQTVLVGTLGAGARGYFILNVTDPRKFTAAHAANLVLLDRTLPASATPAATAQDADIGHIFAAPVVDDANTLRVTQITRMNNNRWAVVLGNGYNSVNQRPVLLIQYLDGDKDKRDNNRLRLKTIVAAEAPSTDAGYYGTANGLSAPQLVDINGDGTADVAYAGDLRGNLWKFDLTNENDTHWQVAFDGKPLYTAVDAAPQASGETITTRQPIFVAPAVKANDRGVGGMMVAFGTGSNLTVADRGNTSLQTIYSVHDNTRYEVDSSKPGSIKIIGRETCAGGACVPAPSVVGAGVSSLYQQQIGAASAGGGASAGQTFWSLDNNDSIDWSRQKGWYLKLPAAGERLLKPMQFYAGSNILAVFTQVPAGLAGGGAQESCAGGAVTAGQQYFTLLNIMDGKPPSVALLDRNGDALYNAEDGNVARTQIANGDVRIIMGPSGNQVIVSGNAGGASGGLRVGSFPELAIRPSWRQAQ